MDRQWRGAASGAKAVLRQNSESESDWPEIEFTQGPIWKQGHVSTKGESGSHVGGKIHS